MICAFDQSIYEKILGPKIDFGMFSNCRLWWGSSCVSCSSPNLSQNPMSSLCVKFPPSSTPPSDRFGGGVLVLVLVLLVVVLVTGVKESQLLV